MLSGQTKDIIHMDTSFNGTDITVFGTLPNKKIKSVNIEFLGPTRQFIAFNTENYEEETISAPSFYAGHNADTIPHFDKLKRYLENNHLYKWRPKLLCAMMPYFHQNYFCQQRLLQGIIPSNIIFKTILEKNISKVICFS